MTKKKKVTSRKRKGYPCTSRKVPKFSGTPDALCAGNNHIFLSLLMLMSWAVGLELFKPCYLHYTVEPEEHTQPPAL